MEQDICYFEPTDVNDYTSFNQLILHAAQTTVTKPKFENKGWFHFSKDALLPAISRRDEILHSLCTATFQATQYLKQALKSAQEVVTNYIALAKETCPANLAQQVHDMNFSPKQAWKTVKILVGGKESHHVKPVVMHVRLPNGNLDTTDAENALILAPYLKRVYTNH